MITLTDYLYPPVMKTVEDVASTTAISTFGTSQTFSLPLYIIFHAPIAVTHHVLPHLDQHPHYPPLAPRPPPTPPLPNKKKNIKSDDRGDENDRNAEITSKMWPQAETVTRETDMTRAKGGNHEGRME